MESQLDVLFRVVERLEGAGIPYMITGSIALNFYAEPRMTRDVDIVIELQSSQADGFAAAFADEFYCEVQAVRRAVEHRKMFNIIHGTGVTKIDFIVRKDSEYRRLEFSRRRPITIRETRLWLVSPEDLLLSKLLWAKQGESERQLHDVKGMLAFVSEELDWSYVAQWAQQLGVDRLLAQVKS